MIFTKSKENLNYNNNFNWDTRKVDLKTKTKQSKQHHTRNNLRFWLLKSIQLCSNLGNMRLHTICNLRLYNLDKRPTLNYFVSPLPTQFLVGVNRSKLH